MKDIVLVARSTITVPNPPRVVYTRTTMEELAEKGIKCQFCGCTMDECMRVKHPGQIDYWTKQIMKLKAGKI